MAGALAASYGSKANIFAWDWHTHADSAFYRPAQAAGFTPSEGTALAKTLISTLTPNYNLPIHFIGHSFGTLVNCTAADYLHGSRRTNDEPKPWTSVYSPADTH